jgi:DNA/RNA endonuclease G (NUC1)
MPEPVVQYKTEITRSENILKLDYPGFTVWLDCSQRGPVKFQYVAQHDSGDFKRYNKFFLDPNVPSECQQKTANAYGHGYDRGHQLCNLRRDAHKTVPYSVRVSLKNNTNSVA